MFATLAACQPFEDAEHRGYSFAATGTHRRLGVPELVNVGGGPNGIRTRDYRLPGHVRGRSLRIIRYACRAISPTTRTRVRRELPGK